MSGNEATMDAVRTREGYDLKLLFSTLLLLLLGLGIVLDASFARAIQAQSTGGDAYFYFKKQAMWAGVALTCLFVCMHVPYTFLRRWWWVGVCAAAGLLVLVMIPGVGIEVNGSRRWLGLGPMRFQPSSTSRGGSCRRWPSSGCWGRWWPRRTWARRSPSSAPAC
jgi:cell division protein FtsW